MYDFAEGAVRDALAEICVPDVLFRLSYPFEDSTGTDAFYEKAYAPLFRAIPDLERRDTIVMAGPTPEGDDWVGCGGYYTGSFEKPWLDIPATGHQVAMRFHEFFRFVDGKVVEFQALWDIPEIMMQANAWPMTPSLGVEFFVPGPATQDGIITTPYNQEESTFSFDLIMDTTNQQAYGSL